MLNLRSFRWYLLQVTFRPPQSFPICPWEFYNKVLVSNISTWTVRHRLLKNWSNRIHETGTIFLKYLFYYNDRSIKRILLLIFLFFFVNTRVEMRAEETMYIFRIQYDIAVRVLSAHNAFGPRNRPSVNGTSFTLGFCLTIAVYCGFNCEGRFIKTWI